MELLITVCALAVSVSPLTVPLHYKPVAYKDVLKTRAYEIQSDINQLYDHEYMSLLCHHRPVYIGDSTKVVIFVWASDRETHAMRHCIYQAMKRIGKNIIRMLQFYNITSVLDKSFNVCNNRYEKSSVLRATERGQIVVTDTLNKRIILETEITSRVIVLSFYVNNPENNGVIAAEASTIKRNNSAVVNVTSRIFVRLLNATQRHMQTFVCNSIQIEWNNTSKLRQRFFSVVGNLMDVIVRSVQTASASVTLDFNVLTLNESRLGLINDSDVELLTLSDLQVACVKRDQYGWSNETNEVVYVNMTEELFVTTRTRLINNKLQLRVNVSLPVVSDHSFGEYVCITYCKLQRKNSVETIDGCFQMKEFSIVLHNWRTEILIYRRKHKFCEKRITGVTKFWNETANDIAREYVNAKWEVFSLQITLIVALIIIFVVIIQNIRQRNYLQALTSLQSVLQSTENSENRNMKYDVFLSYSSKDRFWVQTLLLKFIESKGFKVCFDERDFLLGCNLVETIAESVYESRKVIAVLSPDYLSSRWCAQYEFLLTYTRILNKEAPFNSLLPIKYRNCQIPNHMNVLRYLDYTTVTNACNDNRSVVAKLLSKFWFYKQCENVKTTTESQFFDDLLSWLGEVDEHH